MDFLGPFSAFSPLFLIKLIISVHWSLFSISVTLNDTLDNDFFTMEIRIISGFPWVLFISSYVFMIFFSIISGLRSDKSSSHLYITLKMLSLSIGFTKLSVERSFI